jgi:hypothetical protein
MRRYGEGMNDAASPSGGLDSEELVLREALARADAELASIAPILRHLLANDDGALFGEEIVARVRGMARDVARQLLDRIALAAGERERIVHDDDDIAAITVAIVGDPAFLAHVHALALEWQLTERLRSRLAADPVLSPLLQTLIASSHPETAALAMHVLAAQARWCQSQRRMELPLAELPGDLLHRALIAVRSVTNAEPDSDRLAAKAEAAVRTAYDESTSRLGLMSQLVTGMAAGATAALSLNHAGFAIFITALGIATMQDRDHAVLSTSETQEVRFVLSLRAAGLMTEAVDEQLLTLRPNATPPAGLARMDAARAAGLLAVANDSAGGGT